MTIIQGAALLIFMALSYIYGLTTVCVLLCLLLALLNLFIAGLLKDKTSKIESWHKAVVILYAALLPTLYRFMFVDKPSEEPSSAGVTILCVALGALCLLNLILLSTHPNAKHKD